MSSEYLKTLSGNARSRYLEKISVLSGVDPYVLIELSVDVHEFPKIAYGDIVNYLVFERSAYSMEEFKSYKSLDSFNQFLCGWVKEIGTKVINNVCVVVGKVLHSQKLKEKPLAVWIISKPDGQILSAHCNCVAGLGETCSHVGAVLFTVENNVRNLEARSVTGVKAYWKVPSAAPGALAASKNIDYTSTEKLLKAAKGEVELQQRSEENDETIPVASHEEIVRNLQSLKDDDLESALFSVIKPFCKDFERSKFCNVLANLYTLEHTMKDLATLIAIGSETSISLTSEECECIELATRKQSKCAAWFEFRLGRITASNFKSCVRTKIEKPSISLIKKICYPTTQCFKSAAMAYGCKHEEDAVRDFGNFMKSHTNCRISDVGFVINHKFPEIGASPDGLVDCDCCPPACIEVKCPFCAKDMSIDEAMLLKNFCLKKDDQHYLPQSHAYFYQCQMQMAVTERRFCYFVVWTKSDMHVEKIAFDENFWNINYNQAKLFFTNVIIPELLGKYYSRRKRHAAEVLDPIEPSTSKLRIDNTITTYCLCKKPDDGKPMIACSNENCAVEWYHMKCVSLQAENIPAQWICQLCK